MLKLPGNIEFTEADLILGLGYKFWIKAIDEKGVINVEQSISLIHSLELKLFDPAAQQFQKNIVDNNHDLECSKFLNQIVYKGIENSNNDAIILVLGFKFWQKIVISCHVRKIKQCNEILGSLKEFLINVDETEPKSIKTFEDSVIHSEDEHLISSVDIDEKKIVVENKDAIFDEHFLEYVADTIPVKISIRKKKGARRKMVEEEKLEYILKRHKPQNKKGTVNVKVICDYCKQVFPSYTSTSLHIDIAHPLKKLEFDEKYKIFKCVIEDCQRLFYSKRDILSHYKRDHRELDQDNTLPISVNGVIIERKCKICGVGSRKINGSMEDHIEYHHGKRRKLHKCALCGIEFHFKRFLDTHLKYHDSKVPTTVCKDCGLETETVEDMRRHIYRKKPKKKPQKSSVNCLYCDYIAETQRECNNHMCKEHDHDPLFCDICGFRANGSKNMYIHKRSSHTEKIKCKYCDKTISRSGYHWHMRENHPEKFLKCSECDKQFLEQQTLDDHMNGHLLLRPHKCQFCGRGFQAMIHKEKHLKLCQKKP